MRVQTVMSGNNLLFWWLLAENMCVQWCVDCPTCAGQVHLAYAAAYVLNVEQ
jgi:hypothetical protein